MASMIASVGGLAPGQHEVAERELLRREMVGDALVDVLVVAAEDGELGLRCEAHGVRLHEPAASRAR